LAVIIGYLYNLSPTTIRVFQKALDIDVIHQLEPFHGHYAGK